MRGLSVAMMPKYCFSAMFFDGFWISGARNRTVWSGGRFWPVLEDVGRSWRLSSPILRAFSGDYAEILIFPTVVCGLWAFGAPIRTVWKAMLGQLEWSGRRCWPVLEDPGRSWWLRSLILRALSGYDAEILIFPSVVDCFLACLGGSWEVLVAAFTYLEGF